MSQPHHCNHDHDAASDLHPSLEPPSHNDDTHSLPNQSLGTHGTPAHDIRHTDPNPPDSHTPPHGPTQPVHCLAMTCTSPSAPSSCFSMQQRCHNGDTCSRRHGQPHSPSRTDHPHPPSPTSQPHHCNDHRYAASGANSSLEQPSHNDDTHHSTTSHSEPTVHRRITSAIQTQTSSTLTHRSMVQHSPYTVRQ